MIRPDELNVRSLHELRALIRREYRFAAFMPMTGASAQDVSDIETRLGTPASGTLASQIGSDADAAAAAGSVHAKIKELRTLVDDLEARMSAALAATLGDTTYLMDTDVAALPVAGSAADLLRALEKRAADTSVANSLAARIAALGGGAAATYFAQSAYAITAANAALLDSGQLAAGDYEVIARFAFGNNQMAAGNAIDVGRADVEHRNAANAANVRADTLHGDHYRLNTTASNAGAGTFLWWPKVTVALNERIRINKVTADTAGLSAYSLWVRPV